MKGETSSFDIHGIVETPRIDKIFHPFTDFDACYVLGLSFNALDLRYRSGLIERTASPREVLDLGFSFYSYFDLIDGCAIMKLMAFGFDFREARKISDLYLDHIAAFIEKDLNEAIGISLILESALDALGLSSATNLELSVPEEQLVVDLISSFTSTNLAVVELLNRQNLELGSGPINLLDAGFSA